MRQVAGLSLPEAEAAVRDVARLHAHYWSPAGAPEPKESFPWLRGIDELKGTQRPLSPEPVFIAIKLVWNVLLGLKVLLTID